jgi:hypothetical protein
LVKRIVEDHGGNVRVTNRSPAGARFDMVFPAGRHALRVEATSMAAPTRKKAPTTARVEGAK